MKKAVVICGPTASGKTDFAHLYAKQNNGEIVNADSMQVYKHLPIITASPERELQNELPYHLYNFQDIDQYFSALQYCNLASRVVRDIENRGKLPIIVGGSGMYISMLIEGYNVIPDIDLDLRQEVRNLHEQLGGEEFFAQLRELDPVITNILKIGDTHRVIRAYEVVKSTGKSITYFQHHDKARALPEFTFKVISLMPERNFLYETCNKRLVKLFETGAIEEVEKVYKQYENLNTTAMKALGVQEIISYLTQQIDIAEAAQLASIKTRRYAKRQCTWFNNQIKDKEVLRFNSQREYNVITSLALAKQMGG